MPNALFYSNVAQQTTLSGSISAGATSINVGATTGFPNSFPYILALDFGAGTEELTAVTAAAGTTLTVTRGYGGTSAQSHSLGAVVRHVYNAQDATDFRTHEASTGAVHGLTGSIVGTSDAQALSNKTLTNPTINAATLSGTFAGAHTYSGALTFSSTLTSSGASLAGSWAGSPTFTGTPVFGATTYTGVQQSNQSAAANVVEATQVTGDTFDRWRVYGDGKQEWGPGNAARDTNLYRSAANILGTQSTFRVEPTNTALDGLAVNLPTATAGDLLNLRVNNAIQAAMGSDGQFRIYGGNAPTAWVTTVTNQGTATFTTNTGSYWRLGKIVFINMYLVVNAAGSGAGVVSVTLPSTPDRSARQVLTVHSESNGPNGSHIGGGECVFFTTGQGGSGATSDRIRIDENSATSRENNITGADLLAGGTITIQGWYREA